MQLSGLNRESNPFDSAGVVADTDGVRRYQDLHPSLVAMLDASVRAAPQAEALVEVGGDRITYQQMWDRAARVAGGLREAGVSPGDRVAIRLPNSIDWMLAFAGIQLAGAIAVPVNTRFTDAEASYVMDDSGSGVRLEPGGSLPDGPSFVYEGAGPKDVAAIFYTSGTTGFPKGALHTHENVLANVETAFRVCGIPRDMGADLRTLVVVPLFHVTGCHSQALVALRGGGAVVIDSAFDGARMIDTLDHERISACTAVPAIYYFILNHPSFAPSRMSAVRWVSYGGAPIAPALVERIAENFPSSRVGNGFGLTESTSIATFLPHEWAAEHADSVGFAAPHTEVAIADADPVSGTGEILIRGQSVCAGYWDKADATSAKYTGNPDELISGLRKLEAGSQRIPMDATPATAHLFIIKPFTGGDVMAKLFSTHPPTAERIARLQAMR